ncbi:unnamed protein product, partial [Nesidiocoris tenuis]
MRAATAFTRVVSGVGRRRRRDAGRSPIAQYRRHRHRQDGRCLGYAGCGERLYHATAVVALRRNTDQHQQRVQVPRKPVSARGQSLMNFGIPEVWQERNSMPYPKRIVSSEESSACSDLPLI